MQRLHGRHLQQRALLRSCQHICKLAGGCEHLTAKPPVDTRTCRRRCSLHVLSAVLDGQGHRALHGQLCKELTPGKQAEQCTSC